MRRPTLDSIRGFDRAVYVVAVGQLVNVFGSGLVYPFATVHFHLEVGIGLAVVGLGLGLKSGTTALGTAIGGAVADSLGRKPVMVASMAGAAVTLAAFAFVPAIAGLLPAGLAASFGLAPVGLAFLAVAAAAGLTTGLYAPAGQAMTADLTADDERDRAYALLKVANNVGFGAGFVVGGLLYAVASVAVFVGDGITSALVAVLLVLFVPRTVTSEEEPANVDEPSTERSEPSRITRLRRGAREWWAAVSKPRVVTLAGVNVGFAVMYAQMQTTVPVVATELGLDSQQLGTLYVLNPLTLVLLQLPIVNRIADWRRTRGLTLAAGIWAVSMLAAWGADLGLGATLGVGTLLGVALVGTHLVVRTVGEILHSPLATALMSDLGDPSERGTQLSLLEIAKRLGMGLGSAVGGWFFDAGLSVYLWPTLIGGCLLVAVGLFGLERRLSPGENGRHTDATAPQAD